MLISCSISNPVVETEENADKPPVTIPSEPEKPAEKLLRSPFISFFDFISPGTSRAALVMGGADKNATIYYTTDASTPTKENGIDYDRDKRQVICGNTGITAVPVGAGATVKAAAYKDGKYSAVTTFIVPSKPELDPPTIVVQGETSNGTVIISMKSNDPSATIYFTRDGSEPTMNSLIYSRQSYQYIINNSAVTGTTAGHGVTIKAFAYSTRYGLTSDITTMYIE